jgi:hypothetical protein
VCWWLGAGSTRVYSIRVRRYASRIRLSGEVAIGRIVVRAHARGEPVALDRVESSVLGEGDRDRMTALIRGIGS